MRRVWDLPAWETVAWIAVMALLSACGGGLDTPSAEGRLGIEVAPLKLSGVTDAEYRIRVTSGPNGGGELVWERDGVMSSRFGDGAGGLSYLGPCDADTGVNSVTLTLNALYEGSGELIAPSSYVNPTPISRDIQCVANTDTSVVFDMTIVRDASQGFFDVAVSFNDVFCSAKLDCVRAGTNEDLELLHNPTQQNQRDLTAVLGLACTGAGVSNRTTYLYMDNPQITCTGGAPFNQNITFDVNTTGNVDMSAATTVDPGGYLFAAAVSRGNTGLASVAYWNVSFGLNDAAFAAAGDCTLHTRATASSTALSQTSSGFVLPANTVYPVIDWSVPLTNATARVCVSDEVNGGGGVSVNYLGYLSSPNQFSWAPGPIYLDYEYNSATGLVSGASASAAPDPITCFGASVRPDEASYTTVVHVAYWGVDAEADGTAAHPFRHLRTAVSAAADGDAIHIHPGVYRVLPSNVDASSDAGVHDQGKSLHIFGDNDDTILEVYGPDGGHRDYNAITLTGASSRVSNLVIHYWPSHSNNYSNAVFARNGATAEVRNIVVENKGSQNWSYSYANAAGSPHVYNALFASNGYATGDYSGSPVYDRALFDYTPSAGTKTDCLTRAVSFADRWLTSAPADLSDPAGGTNLIGTAGGSFAWDTCCAPDGSADADADGHPDACDPCPADVVGDADQDGVCESDDQCLWGPDDIDADQDGVVDACDLCLDDATNSCSFFPDPADYPTVWNVAPTGDDTSGDGTAAAPFATLDKAITSAVSGDGVRVWPGLYHVPLMYRDSYGYAGIFDQSKTLHIWGANEHTILEVYGGESPNRDGNVLVFYAPSQLSNLKIHYYPGKSSNYSNAVLAHCNPGSTVRNVIFENKSTTTNWSLSYDNSNGGGPYVYNSIFISHGRQTGNYSGAVHYFSSIIEQQPSSGTLDSCLVRASTTADWFWPSRPADLRNTGVQTSTDPDGLPTSIGTGGGPLLWNTTCPPDGSADADEDGHPDSCDSCPADATCS